MSFQAFRSGDELLNNPPLRRSWVSTIFMTPLLYPCDQAGRWQIKSKGNAEEHIQGGTSLVPFKKAYVGAVELSPCRKFILRKVCSLAGFP